MIYTQMTAFFWDKWGVILQSWIMYDHVTCLSNFEFQWSFFFPSCNPAAVVRVQIHACHDLLMISAHGSMSRALALAGGWHQICSAAGGVLKTTNTSGGLEFSKDYQKITKSIQKYGNHISFEARRLQESFAIAKCHGFPAFCFLDPSPGISLKHPEINGGRDHWTWIRNMFPMFSSKSGNPQTNTHAFIVFFRPGAQDGPSTSLALQITVRHRGVVRKHGEGYWSVLRVQCVGRTCMNWYCKNLHWNH